jgi:hypothetical protein
MTRWFVFFAGPVASWESTPVRHVQVLNPDYSQKPGRIEMFDKFRERQQAQQ